MTLVTFSLPHLEHINKEGPFVGLCFAIAARNMIPRTIMVNISNCNFALKKPLPVVKNKKIYIVK